MNDKKKAIGQIFVEYLGPKYINSMDYYLKKYLRSNNNINVNKSQ